MASLMGFLWGMSTVALMVFAAADDLVGQSADESVALWVASTEPLTDGEMVSHLAALKVLNVAEKRADW